jgi:hypothetical protein
MVLLVMITSSPLTVDSPFNAIPDVTSKVRVDVTRSV